MSNKIRNHKLIHHFLENSAAIYPDKIALIHEEVRATYTEINNSANQLARWLQDQGISIGDRVVLILENCLDYVVSYFGVLKAGAVVVPLSSDLKPDPLCAVLRELEPKVIVVSAMFHQLITAVDMTSFKPLSVLVRYLRNTWTCSSIPITKWTDVVNSGEVSNCTTPINTANLASIVYTSGSTGHPKGVMLSHENIVSNVHSICQSLDITNKDTQMIVLPFFYVMGKSLLNTHFAAGGTVVLNNKFAYSGSVIQQMIDEKVTAFSGVPSTYAYLLHRSSLLKYRDRLEHLRYCSQAGGHMSLETKAELMTALPKHTKIYIMYGASEASARISCLEPERYIEKMGSIGKPINGVTLRLLDKNGKKVSVGQIGEIVVSGANVMQGYWKDSQLTSSVLTENGYRTGDMGYQDADGYFYVTGREDNMLKVNGHRINTQEVEDAMMATGLVAEALVFGLPDKLLGNRLFALAASKKVEFSEYHILKSCSAILPKHKLPTKLKLIRSLPKKANGKINRSKCIELINSL